MTDYRGYQMAELEHADRLAAVKRGYERELTELARTVEHAVFVVHGPNSAQAVLP